MSLDGRAAIVTGANTGIGLAIALALAKAGARIVVAGRTEEANAAAVEQIRELGGEAIALRYDASCEADADALVAAALEHFGRLDVCVANAGGTVGGTAPLVEMTAQMWRDTVALNLDGVFFLYRAATRRMIEAGSGGSLITISSVASIQAAPSLHYASAKGGVNSMTMNLSVQLGRHGIRVNAILPGLIETRALKQGVTEKMRESILKRIPLRRIGEPDDIADLALFLAGDASSFITGQLITVDGGMTKT